MRHRKLLIAAASLALIWIAGWFALSARADAEMDRKLADFAGRGVVVLCPNRDVTGFPLMFEVGCAGLVARDGRSGLRVAAGPTSVRGGLVHPTSIVVDLGSPFTIRRALDAATIRLDWEEARVTGAIGLGGARSGSVRIEEGIGRIADRRLAFSGFSTALDPSGDGSHLAVRADDLSLLHDTGGSTPLDLVFEADITASPASLASGNGSDVAAEDIRLRGETEGILLTGDGRVGLNVAGLPAGRLTIRLSGIGALPGFIATLPPDLQPLANSAAGALMAFGRATMVDGSEAREMEVTVSEGIVRLGSMPLGRIGGF